MNTIPCLKLNSNKLMPIFGYGTASVKDLPPYRSAIECGYRLFDTAFQYKTEEVVGTAIQEAVASGKHKREDFFIVTKLPNIGNQPEDVDRYLKESLRRLKMDYVDLYLIHHPFRTVGTHMEDWFPKDENGKSILGGKTDFENLWKAMEQKVDEGLVKSIGVSNFNSQQIRQIMKTARIPPAVNEVEAHIYLQQTKLYEVCQQYGIHFIAFGTLGAAHFSRVSTEGIKYVLEDPVLNRIADSKDRTAAQVAMRFLIQLGYSIIARSGKAERIRSNFQLFDFSLSDDEMSELKNLEIGPESRVYIYTNLWVGIDKHEDFPFNIPF